MTLSRANGQWLETVSQMEAEVDFLQIRWGHNWLLSSCLTNGMFWWTPGEG